MGISTADINATYQEIGLDVIIDGTHVSSVVAGVDVSAGLSQANAQALIHCTSRPSVADELKTVEIWYSLNGGTEILFRGELTGRTYQFFPDEIALECRDLLARVRYEWGGDDRTYESQDDAAIIRNLLEAMGIPSNAANIESSSWTLGTAKAVVAPAGRAFLPLIQEIDGLAGYRTFTDRTGAILRRRVSGAVGTGAAFSYETGDNMLSISRKIATDGIRNRAIVTGVTFLDLQIGPATAQASNPFVPDPPKYVGPPVQSDLIEDLPKAQEIADRLVADGNRRPEVYELRVVCNPKLSPINVIDITAPEVDTGSGRFVVDRVAHSIRLSGGGGARVGDPMATTTITTLGGNIVATETNLPPIASFVVTLFAEGKDNGGGDVERVVVAVCDGSASTDPDGDTLVWGWALSVDTGTVDPATSSDVVVRAVIEGGATELTVELTVTDADGATNVAEQVLPLTESVLLIEPLYTAEEDTIAASNDGELTWGEFAVASGATCLAPFAPAWGGLWGDADGELWASIDYLATDAVSLGTPHGAVACTAVWVHETDTTRGWAAFADGAVYRGVITTTAPSAVWTLAGTIPEGPVQEIREAVGSFGSLRATAGQGYYRSSDGGATWTLLHTFDVAWRMAAGFGRNFASGLNDPSPLFEEDAQDVALPGGTTHIRGLSLGWRVQELYLADDAGNLLRSDDLITATVVDTAPAGVNHLVRSGNADGVVYGATDDGAIKTIRNEAPFFIRQSPTTCHMVGYGPAHGPPIGPYAVIVLPYGASGADDKIWYLANGVWAGLTPPRASWYWECICVNPADQNEWLLYGVSNSGRLAGRASANNIVYGDNGGLSTTGTYGPLYRSLDAGATWSPVPLTLTATDGDHLYAQNHYMVYSEDVPGLWMLTARNTFFNNHSYTWRGTGGGTVAGIKHASTSLHNLTGGLNGEFLTSTISEAPLSQTADMAYLDTASGIQPIAHDGSTSPAYTWQCLETLPATRRALGRRANAPSQVWGTTDYRAATVVPLGAANGSVLTAALHGVYTTSLTGVEQIADAFAGSTPVQVGTDHNAMATIRAGRRRRLAVVAMRTDGVAVATTDGATWQTLTAPPVSSSSLLNLNHIEVVEP